MPVYARLYNECGPPGPLSAALHILLWIGMAALIDYTYAGKPPEEELLFKSPEPPPPRNSDFLR
jgi:hypothetical protein